MVLVIFKNGNYITNCICYINIVFDIFYTVDEIKKDIIFYYIPFYF